MTVHETDDKRGENVNNSSTKANQTNLYFDAKRETDRLANLNMVAFGFKNGAGR